MNFPPGCPVGDEPARARWGTTLLGTVNSLHPRNPGRGPRGLFAPSFPPRRGRSLEESVNKNLCVGVEPVATDRKQKGSYSTRPGRLKQKSPNAGPGRIAKR